VSSQAGAVTGPSIASSDTVVNRALVTCTVPSHPLHPPATLLTLICAIAATTCAASSATTGRDDPSGQRSSAGPGSGAWPSSQREQRTDQRRYQFHPGLPELIVRSMDARGCPRSSVEPSRLGCRAHCKAVVLDALPPVGDTPAVPARTAIDRW
jgi:hypothetical protein